VVIGAGFAGLSAAWSVAGMSVAVTVVEARERVGGRVWSIELPNGAVAELGGEWIEPEESAVRDLAASVGVRLLPAGMAYRRREALGWASADEQERARLEMGMVRAGLTDAEVARITLADLLDRTPIDERVRATLRARLQGTFGADLSAIALRAADGYGGTEGGAASDLRAEGGNQRIAEAVAAGLPDVRLRHMVNQVDHLPDGVVVRGEARGAPFTLEATVAVVAVPAPLIGDMGFSPPLPPGLARALRELPMGVAAKLAVPLAEPSHPRAIQEVEAPFWCWTAMGEGGVARSALTAFAGSPAAMRSLGVGAGDPEPWLRRMLALNPDVAVAGDPVMVEWEGDPLARGCYAAFDNRSFDRIAVLSEPVGRLVFAGEHTAGAVGTMNGAVLTGRRAASQVAGLLGLSD
jgi:monoamine oxidase